MRLRNAGLALCMMFGFLLEAPINAADIRNGRQLIEAMHARYEASWYRTVTFVQTSTTIHPDGSREDAIWDEAIALPGRLRIDVEPRSAGNGRLFVDGKLMTFKDGQPTNTRDFIHPLLVLGFDVYRQPVEKTLSQLKDFDLSILHEAQWQGRPTYVVGARQGDEKTTQFWVDLERLVFVRLIRPDEQHPGSTYETRFDDYRRLEGGWISPTVVFLTDGKPTFEEHYTDVKANIKLDDRLFDPSQFARSPYGRR